MVKHDSEGNALKVGMKVLVTLETPYGFHSAQHAMEKSAWKKNVHPKFLPKFV